MKKIVKIIPEKSIKGFSLIEFVIVLLIASIIIVGVGEWYRIYTASRALKITEERIERVQEALTLYFAVTGRFPRPAVPSISFENPEAGNERAIAGVPVAPPPIPPCGGGDDDVCATIGRQTPYQGELAGGHDRILIGAIPYKTLKAALGSSGDISMLDALDGWGSKFTYAISEPLTDEGEASLEYGAIDIKSDVAGVSLATASDNVLLGLNRIAAPGGACLLPDWEHCRGYGILTIVSHGPNRAGARSETGQISTPCPAGTTNEAENCNNIGVFVKAVRRFDSAAYYDDVVYFLSAGLSNLWQNKKNTMHIYNTNPGNVGIATGTTQPEEKLTVNGYMRAHIFRAREYCTDDGICLDPDKIGGDGMVCDQALLHANSGGATSPTTHRYVLRGFEAGIAVCEPVLIAGAYMQGPQTCEGNPAGEYIVGIDMVSGIILCGEPP